MSDSFDLVIVGSGFASAFFLSEYLRHVPQTARVLVLEWGRSHDHAWQQANQAHSDITTADQFINRTPQKPWIFNLAFGGGSCWTGNTPRLHPNDFRTKSLYGVGEDWPITYDELEPDYVRSEEIMGISGAPGGPYPRSRAYPLPAHRFNAFDEAFKKKYPDAYLPMPSARASIPTRDRPACCGNGICSNCPVGAKFQVDLHMRAPFEDPRVVLRLNAKVKYVDIVADVARSVIYEHGGKEERVSADLVAVGANAVMTPFLLMRSGLTDQALGHYLNEQIGREVSVMLDGVKNFGGSTSATGLGTMFMDGPFRAKRPGCLLENWNVPWLRADAGRWRERGLIKLVFEDVPQYDKFVGVSKEDPELPEVVYERHSDYLKAGFDEIPRLLDDLFSGMPVEGYEVDELEGLSSDAHIQGTVRMGSSPDSSVVDDSLRHHRVRNLLALGSSVFPTCPTANPTLTLTALSLRAARQLFA